MKLELAGFLIHERMKNWRIKGDKGRFFVVRKVVRNVNSKFEYCTTVIARSYKNNAEPDERRLGRRNYVNTSVRAVFLGRVKLKIIDQENL